MKVFIFVYLWGGLVTSTIAIIALMLMLVIVTVLFMLLRRKYTILKNEKNELEGILESYLKKNGETKPEDEAAYNATNQDDKLAIIIREDLSRLIARKLPDRNDYQQLLEDIDMSFITLVRKLFEGHITVQYLKYCACFAIGMGIADVSECFSIEQASVHMLRYRLKKKFGFSNKVEFDLFLRSLIKQPTVS